VTQPAAEGSGRARDACVQTEPPDIASADRWPTRGDKCIGDNAISIARLAKAAGCASAQRDAVPIRGRMTV
jgi:hypothetical protein